MITNTTMKEKKMAQPLIVLIQKLLETLRVRILVAAIFTAVLPSEKKSDLRMLDRLHRNDDHNNNSSSSVVVQLLIRK
jgi:hypothetical protein